MVIVFSLLALWGLLFVPLGLVIQWGVLGPGARQRALPLAGVTGIAAAVLVLATLGRFGIDAGDTGVSWVFVGLALLCLLVIWRCEVPWRSKELIGLAIFIALAAFLIQLPVVGTDSDGPLGYGTVVDPVGEVAAVDAASHSASSGLTVARDAHAQQDHRPIGFEEFAALTVSLGQDDGTDRPDATWSAYTLHAPITGVLAILTILPLLSFARARGVGWLGLATLVPLGALAPAVFLAIANGAGAAIITIPLTTATIFSLLVTRRDRGWWALALIFGGAVAACGGVLALLPVLVVGAAWVLLRSDTYEHLAQGDAGTARVLPLVVAALAFVLGSIAVFPTLGGGDGVLLAWDALHSSLLDAVRSWPFAWLDSDLSTAGPDGIGETVVWLVGPVLLVVAGIYAVTRNERRELGVLVGMVVAVLIGVVAALFDREKGIELFEYTVLVLAPLLAALAVRGVSLARTHAEDQRRNGDAGRWAGRGPALLFAAFVVLSIAATGTTGSRMVHAPGLLTVDHLRPGTTLVAGGDPWLQYVVDGIRPAAGAVDADALAAVHPPAGVPHSIVYGADYGYAKLVLSSSPIASDPPPQYRENPALDSYQARLFYNRTQGAPSTPDAIVDPARLLQRVKSNSADRDTSGTDASTTPTDDIAAATEVSSANSSSFEAALSSVLVPEEHTPVEPDPAKLGPSDPGGLLIPGSDVPGCSPADDFLAHPTCKPAEPEVGGECDADAVDAVRSDLDTRGAHGTPSRAAVKAAGADDVQIVELEEQGAAAPESPRLLGVRCFDVALHRSSRVLGVHLRDVGVVLSPETATVEDVDGDWATRRDRGGAGGGTGKGGLLGGVRRTSTTRGATLAYGNQRLLGQFDLTLEGSLGAGVDIGTAPSPTPVPDASSSSSGDTVETTTEDVSSSIGSLRGSADGFSQIVRGQAIQGTVLVRNGAGTNVELGRLFARPRDLPRSCDVPIALRSGQRREIQLRSTSSRSADDLQVPGVSVAITSISGSGGARVAHVVVGSYLAVGGLPRTMLIDWTEQYTDTVDVEGCDGVVHTEMVATTP